MLELGNTTAALADVIQESTTFIAACYGHVEAVTMTDVRFNMWKVKTANANIVSAPKHVSPSDQRIVPPECSKSQFAVLYLEACCGTKLTRD